MTGDEFVVVFGAGYLFGFFVACTVIYLWGKR